MTKSQKIAQCGARGVLASGKLRLGSACVRFHSNDVSGPRSSLLGTGFTLVELLVVIAIIGMLAAMMLPMTGRMRGRAESVKSISNLRQIHQGFITYATMNDGRAPPFRHDDPDLPAVPWRGGGSTRTWLDYLHQVGVTVTLPREEIPSGAVYCPTYYRLVRRGDVYSNHHSAGYGFNFNLNRYFGNFPPAWGAPHCGFWSLMAVPSAALNILATTWASHALNQWDLNRYPNRTASYETAPDWGFWHSRMGHIVFVDGHVQSREELMIDDLAIRHRE